MTHPRSRGVRSALHVPRALAAILCASSLSVTLFVTGGVVPASAAAPPAFASLSARQIVTSAMAEAKAKGSAISSSATTISGQAYSSITDSSVTSGQRTLRIGPAKSVVRVVHGMVYVNDDDAAIQAQFGVSAPKDANKWIAIPPTNSNFVRFNSGILLASMLSQLSPAGVLKVAKPIVLRHTLVVGVTGKPNIHLGLASGTETLYVAVTGSHVPIELVASDIIQGQRQTFVIVFSNWGRDFHLTTPPKTLAISATKLPS